MENETMFTISSDGKLELYKEPYATIECATEEDYKVIVEALEKQKPKVSNCYMCNDTSNSRYYENKNYKFCPHCGQALKY